jgi:hypothetical protein
MQYNAILDVLMALNLHIDKINQRYGITVNFGHIMVLHCIAGYNEKEIKCGEKLVSAALQKNKRRKSANMVIGFVRHLVSCKLVKSDRSGTNDEVRKFYYLTKTGKMLLDDFSTLLLTQKKVSD